MNLIQARLRGGIVGFGSTELRLAGAEAARRPRRCPRPAADRLGRRRGPPAIRAGRGWAPGLDVVEQLGSECNCCSQSTRPGRHRGREGGDRRRERRRRVRLLADEGRARYGADPGAPARRPARGGRAGDRPIATASVRSRRRRRDRGRAPAGGEQHEGVGDAGIAALLALALGLAAIADGEDPQADAGAEERSPAARQRRLRLPDRRRLSAARRGHGRLARLVRRRGRRGAGLFDLLRQRLSDPGERAGVDRPDERARPGPRSSCSASSATTRTGAANTSSTFETGPSGGGRQAGCSR